MGDPGANEAPSYSATTDFESKSHEELLRMVRDANSERVSQLGQTLVDAGADLDQIGSDLKRDMGALLWEGKAGDAFRAWGHKVAIAAEYLADYSDTAGRFMKDAGATLADVKSAMPEVPTESKRIADAYAPGMSEEESMAKLGYCPSPEAVTRAKQDTTDAHAEAVRQMTKLGQAYNMSREIISDLEPPEIPPPPTEPMPSVYSGGDEYASHGQVASSAREYSSEFTRYAGDSGGIVDNSPHSPRSGVGDASATAARIMQPGGDGINGGLPLSPNTGLPQVPEPATRTDSVSVPAALSDPVTHQSVARTPAPTDVPGGPVVPPNSTFAPSPPNPSRGIRAGSIETRSRRGLDVPFMSRSSGPATTPRLGPRTGVYGGLPVSESGPRNQIPRGTVVGSEQGMSQTGGRPPLVGGMGNVVGGQPSDNSASGRRLANEPGGVVGSPRGSQNSTGKVFTPGGSGLVRRQSQPHSSRGAGQSGRRSTSDAGEERQESRHALGGNSAEGDGSWIAARHRTAPPVIE